MSRLAGQRSSVRQIESLIASLDDMLDTRVAASNQDIVDVSLNMDSLLSIAFKQSKS